MTLQIDARAVHAELQAMSTAMSEVTRQMGPQTWQGGSAAAFTTDLQGHTRALNRLMLDVERTVVRSNQVPLALDPPEIPRVTPPAGKPGVASVSPSALERLETALTRAAADLPHRAKMIRGLMAPAHPDVPSTASCDNAAAWCRTEAARMRTRIMYALAETEVTATPLIQGPVIQIPDLERFGTKEMTDLARLQARAWQKHTLHPGAATPALMSEIARTLSENSKNTAYLATFFSNIPPGSAGKLPYHLHQLGHESGLSPEDKKTVGNLGTALAALSRKHEDITAKALGPAGADMPGQALLVKLSAPNVKWSSAILTDLGKAALRWRQKHPSYEITHTYDAGNRGQTKVLNQPHGLWWKTWGISGPSGMYPDPKTLREYDPALAVLGRISSQKDLTAARNLASMKLDGEFLIKDPDKAPALTWLTRGTGDTYASLIVAPDWPDGGTVAGSVIQLATTPVEGHEEQAALNAAEIMKSVGWWNDKGREKVEKPLKDGSPPDLVPWFDILPRMDQAPPGTAHSEHNTLELGPGLRTGLLQMAHMYVPALGQANRTASGTGLPYEDPVTGRTFTEIGGQDMEQFLRTFAADDRAWAQIAVDTEIYRQRLFAWGIKNHNLNDAITKAGYLEDVLIAAFGKERITREELTKKQYEDAQKHLGLLRDLGGAALGVSPAATVPGATDAYTIGSTLLLDKVKYADFDKKVQELRGTYATYSDQLYRDLAIGLYLAKGTRTGAPEMDKLLQEARSSDYKGPEIIRGIQKYDFAEPGAKERRTGFSIVGDTQLYVKSNTPDQ